MFCKKTFCLEKTDDIDNLENKRIRMVSEILNKEILGSINVLKENIKKNINSILTKDIKNKHKYLINPRILTVITKKFLSLNPLSQIIDDINPVSQITHKRKIVSSQKSNNKTSNTELREIQSSFFKKVCPVETSEGKNAGLVWSLAKNSKINKKGVIETPIYF